MTTTAAVDKWAAWVRERSYGGDPRQRRETQERLHLIRDRVLDNARLSTNEVLLDVGTGEGLVGFGALARLGPQGRVIFSDISRELLDHCERLASERGVLDRSDFLQASADDLSPLPDCSVDVVTTRSVLIFLPRERKRQAFREFHRVLRAGGRVSIFEPINNYFGTREDRHTFWGFDVAPIRDLADKVKAAEERAHPAETSPMMDFDERDLLADTRAAGFSEVQLDLVVTVAPGAWFTSWNAFRESAGNPLSPTIGECIEDALAPEEAERLEAHLRPLVDSGRGMTESAFAYLSATRD